jgi:uncharacterized protein YecE (DUF72 family)
MITVGTSGYNYPEWRGSFYPEKLPAKQMFAFYAERFRTVEINYTFYRIPTAKTTAKWLEQAPDGFTYVLKAPRLITHVKRLKDCADAVAFFCESARVLGDHLGPLLFQLPPSLRCDLATLETFLKVVPLDMRIAVEFRHESWLVDETFEMLAACSAAVCIADSAGRTTPIRATARHGYFRLRDSGYTDRDLDWWASEVAARAAEWDDVYVFFKHEDEGTGPEFAARFVERLRARGLTVA